VKDYPAQKKTKPVVGEGGGEGKASQWGEAGEPLVPSVIVKGYMR